MTYSSIRYLIEQQPKNERKAFCEGMLEGIKLFAWWKNGVEWVGSGNLTLKQAEQKIIDSYKECT